MNREVILQDTKEILPYAVRLREQLHRNPELSFREYETSKIIEGELRDAGIPYHKVGTGIVATIQGRGSEAAGTIGIRADMDALPMKEESGEAFASSNGNMHACGHDLHMAMVMAAGKLLHRKKDKLQGTVKLIFQPAEEIGQGAEKMIRSGLLEGIDTILALHMDPQEDVGILQTGYGARTTSGCCVELELSGSQEMLFPAVAQAIHLIAGRMAMCVKTTCPYTLSPTVVRMPDANHLKLFYDGRVFCPEDSRQIETYVRDTAYEVSRVYPVNISVGVERVGGTVENHSDSVDRAVHTFSGLFGQESVRITGPAMFGEDFRCYAEVADKLVFSLLGGGCGEKEYPLHNCKVRFSNSAIEYGIAFYLGYIEEYFEI